LRRIAVTVLVLALVAGTTTAFTLTQALKLQRSPVTKPVFDRLLSPRCRCSNRVVHLAFVLRKPDRLSAEIVDAHGTEVRTLLEHEQQPKGRVDLVWNGRSDSGLVVADGAYRLRIHLDEAHRTIVMPPRVTVDTRPPRGRILRASRQTISPDGDRRADTVTLRYRSSEAARVLLLVNGIEVERTRFRAAGVRTVVWDGRQRGRPAPPAAYRLSLRFLDRAGNLSPPTQPVRVRVRYVELAVRTSKVPRGGTLRFTIDSDAASVAWVLRKGRKVVLRGTGEGSTAVSLPQRIRRGKYVLRVELRGHAASAPVRVVRRG
jgi:flagellar hook assembly protein FlgD